MEKHKKSTIYVNSIYGHIEAFENDLITDQIIRFGNHTRPDFSFALSPIDTDTKLFDLGAHVGTFSLPALAKLKDSSQILALEGNPHTYSVLQRNIESKGYRNAYTLNTFLANNNDYVYQENTSNTGAGCLIARRGSESINVDYVTLDELTKQFFTPDFIKIDIEGMEFSILSNSDTIQESRPIIYMEVSKKGLSEHGHSAKDLDQFMKKLDYRFFVNIGDRNAKHDFFCVHEIRSLHTYKSFFDVLCVPVNSDKFLALRRTCHSRKIYFYNMPRRIVAQKSPVWLKTGIKTLLHSIHNKTET